jgi:hypothetical protein
MQSRDFVIDGESEKSPVFMLVRSMSRKTFIMRNQRKRIVVRARHAIARCARCRVAHFDARFFLDYFFH